MENYNATLLPVYAGDSFITALTCSGTSSISNLVITSFSQTSIQIDVPSIKKEYVGNYYRNKEVKTGVALAPGDYVEFMLTYDSKNVKAPAKRVSLYDFYPYVISDLSNITYEVSDQTIAQYTSFPIAPNGAMWSIPQIIGEKLFTIKALAQISYQNNQNSYLMNLFKEQLVNTVGIAFSRRDQVAITLGNPNLIVSTSIEGNNPNNIKIGEQYRIKVSLKNTGDSIEVTDAFSFTLDQSIPIGVTLLPNTISANIGTQTLQFTNSNSNINVPITKLAPNEELILNYAVFINETLAPGNIFDMKTTVSRPYTQMYDLSTQNLQYSSSIPVVSTILRAAPLDINIQIDKPTIVVGENATYTFDIIVPEGQRLSAFQAIIVKPDLNQYLGLATLNGRSVSASISGNNMIFPTVNDIDTTSGALTYQYKILCKVQDCYVNVNTPTVTLETVYGNISYTTMLSQNYMEGISDAFEIQHPFMVVSTMDSQTLMNYKQYLILRNASNLYTKISLTNTGLTTANNTTASVIFPPYISFMRTVQINDKLTISYDTQQRKLTITSSATNVNEVQEVIIESSLLLQQVAGTVSILTFYIDTYKNAVSTDKNYTTSIVNNSYLYYGSNVEFIPGSQFSVSSLEGALNISKRGVPTHIDYFLTNKGLGLDSYELRITSFVLPYDIYIDDIYVDTIEQGETANIVNDKLSNVQYDERHKISIQYMIPLEEASGFYTSIVVTITSRVDSSVTKSIPTGIQDP